MITVNTVYLKDYPQNNTSLLYYTYFLYCTCMSYFYTSSCSCFVNIQAIRSSLARTHDAEESSELTQLQRIRLDVSKLKEMCQSLIKHQAAFERELTSRLDLMQGCLDELVVLAPTSSNCAISTSRVCCFNTKV